MASTVLRTLVSARHWQRYETFARQFERTADELADLEQDEELRTLTISRRQFERWCSGTVSSRPRPNQCRVLEKMFGVPVDTLLGPPQFATEVDTAAADDPIGAAAENAFRFLVATSHFEGGDLTLEQLTEDVRQLNRVHLERPSAACIEPLAGRQRVIFEMLSRQQRPNRARDLYVLASIVSGLLAKASHDLGDERSAMTQARSALLCADSAGYGDLKAWSFAIHAVIQYWSGNPRLVSNYTQQGRSALEDRRGSVAIWLAALEARAEAQLGHGPEAERAAALVAETRQEWRPSQLDELGGLFNFPPVKELYYLSEARILSSPPTERVIAQAERAVIAYETAGPGEFDLSCMAGARTNLALVHAKAGDADAALAALTPVFESDVETHIQGVVVGVQRVANAVADLKSPSAVALRDAARQFVPAGRAHLAKRPLPELQGPQLTIPDPTAAAR